MDRHRRLAAARVQTDRLFGLVEPRLYYERPIAARHRIVFYIGHLEVFDLAKLGLGQKHPPRLSATLERLFERGIDPAPGREPHDAPGDWPSVEAVGEFACRARAVVDALVDDATEAMVDMVIEHRLMHAETLAYMLHNLPFEAKTAPPAGPRPIDDHVVPSRVDIPQGDATLGRARGDGFGWDNEFEAHRVPVAAFSIDRYKVTNGEYLEYLEAGGTPSHFWERLDGEWLWRGMFRAGPLPLDAPVYVTHDQAAAYAKWKGRRLPTEAEYHRAAFGTAGGEERLHPWGDAPPTPARAYADFLGFDPVAVDATPDGDSAFGVSQLAGNGWEWTSTVFGPLPGFEPMPAYPAYSADFFDGEHFVLKGGSPRTAACLLRRSFRNWFRGDYPYVYASFRTVGSAR